MKLVSALLLRNEGSVDRYLRPVLACLQGLCDEIVVLDDASTDDTVEICRGFGAEVEIRDPHIPRAWGAEATARLRLWQLASAKCGPRDWLLIADGDMVLHGDPRPLMQTRECNAIAWRLYDVWADGLYRHDQFWQGHLVPRVWMVQPHSQPNGWTPHWERAGIHVGHLPTNFMAYPMVAPEDVYWLHLGWRDPKHREKKAQDYLSRSHLLNDFERAHAQSILDPNP